MEIHLDPEELNDAEEKIIEDEISENEITEDQIIDEVHSEAKNDLEAKLAEIKSQMI